MKSLYWLLPVLLLGLIGALFRPALDVDIFNLLPGDSATVRGLQTYQQNFGSATELLLLVGGPEPDTTREAVTVLAAELLDARLAGEVIWQIPFQAAPEAHAELLAYLWFNQDPDRFTAMAERFSEGEIDARLEQTLERMALSFQPLEVLALGSDPFELGTIGAEIDVPLPGAGKDPFASEDGRFRLLIVAAPFEEGGFLAVRRWVTEVRGFLDGWQDQHGDITVGVTGNPAFLAESGNALLRDLLGAALGTTLMVALLFYLVHRRWQPLIALVLLLGVVLGVTAVIGDWLFGGLHAVSLGFAAILLGLAADYGLILYQEAKSHPELTIAAQRSAVLPAIGWSSVTTAGAFFMISRSSLPGLTQLGVLVGIGVLLAAVVMLAAYLSLAGRGRTEGQPKSAPLWSRVSGRGALWISVIGLVVATAVVAGRPPTVNADARSLALESGSSRATLEALRTAIGGFADDHWLIVSGGTEAAVRTRLLTAAPHLATALRDGLIDGYQLPHGLWPDADAQRNNRATLSWLIRRQPSVVGSLEDAGFTQRALTHAVFEGWSRFSGEDDAIWPRTGDASWLIRQFAARSEDGVVALGRLQPAAGTSDGAIAALGETIAAADGGRLVSWMLLARSLLGTVERDLTRVLVPMSMVLLALLFVAFRRPGEVLLSVAALTLSLLGLLVTMSLAGWSWNLMNVMALPMLFGAGVDYALHVQFAMRRHEGAVSQVRNGVGRAILLCAGSTAAGFATLGFAGNAGIASLGKVCAAGILITSLVAVFLLPAWWRIMPGYVTSRGARA